LISAGCFPGAARSLSDAFLRAAHQINDSYQTTYRKSYKALAQQMPSQPIRLSRRLDHVRSAFERQYRDRILAAEQLAMDRAQSYQPAARALHTKPAFNQVLVVPNITMKNSYPIQQEFVPFLEKYFEYNAYPSAPDRIALARKSMMTPRQIEVWVRLPIVIFFILTNFLVVSKSPESFKERRQTFAQAKSRSITPQTVLGLVGGKNAVFRDS
jgi:hypothetical protein